MPSTQLVHWSLWGLSLVAGVFAVVKLVRLVDLQNLIPTWQQAEEAKARLPVLQEELRQATEAIDRCRAEIGQLEATLGHLRILKEWNDANPMAAVEIAQKQQDLARCNSELAAIQQKLAEDEATRKAITKEVSELTQKKADLEGQIPILRDRLAALYNDENKLQAAIRALVEQHEKLNQDVIALANDFQTQQARLKTLLQQVEKAELEKAAALRERDQARADRDTAKAELVGIQRSIEQLRDLAKGMQNNLKEAGVTGGGNYEALSTPVLNSVLPPTKSVPDERVALERARDYIRGKGLVFPERIIHAFHTSLKTGDISPLVVLAGISGTGKSELPRHYADGMGIHFLLTAVQPRWDSPQDLFGFYNYLERRYKATELARALVQFEKYNQAAFEAVFEDATIDDRSDRMLLVLLDEMNLARTEYYFSEFLSKLETRRMVNTKDDADRTRAEIELDMGGSLGNNKLLRLFPGYNVLFVGTMNEDESTQSLSDKVIDRASVLRFGRPKRTNPSLNGGRQPAPTNGLRFDHWEKWLRKPENLQGHAKTVDLWIDRLNEALDRLGRPFAFRVDRAIRSYVANYPDWVTDWHKRAMADQIEQRIFPKLRGVEPDQGEAPQSLRTISSIIDELDDEPLKKAFEASHVNQSTFLFRGVVRDESE
jgi:uncharacterized coiled-coil DUF342 family protein